VAWIFFFSFHGVLPYIHHASVLFKVPWHIVNELERDELGMYIIMHQFNRIILIRQQIIIKVESFILSIWFASTLTAPMRWVIMDPYLKGTWLDPTPFFHLFEIYDIEWTIQKNKKGKKRRILPNSTASISPALKQLQIIHTLSNDVPQARYSVLGPGQKQGGKRRKESKEEILSISYLFFYLILVSLFIF